MARNACNYYKSRRDDIIALLPAGLSRILDVGCGMGFTGRAIKDRMDKKIEVIGIEKEKDIAEYARNNIDNVIVGDVENVELPFPDKYFDCIIYGDVLEHLVDPWRLLSRHLKALTNDGYVALSIPNIIHYRVLKLILRDGWQYCDSGVLDKTHLRFFTLKTIRKMLADAGLEIVDIRRKIIASKSKKIINKILFGALQEYLTEQYIILARKRNG